MKSALAQKDTFAFHGTFRRPTITISAEGRARPSQIFAFHRTISAEGHVSMDAAWLPVQPKEAK